MTNIIPPGLDLPCETLCTLWSISFSRFYRHSFSPNILAFLCATCDSAWEGPLCVLCVKALAASSGTGYNGFRIITQCVISLNDDRSFSPIRRHLDVGFSPMLPRPRAVLPRVTACPELVEGCPRVSVSNASHALNIFLPFTA